MEVLPENKLLQLSQDVLINLRKIHNMEQPRLDQSIDAIEDWIKKQDHLVKKDYSREYLERVLITCKGSIEKAKKQIDVLATYRTLLPFFFSKVNIKEECKDIQDILLLVPLPKLTKDYYRIIVAKVDTQNFKSEYFLSYFQRAFITSEYIKRHDYVNGFGVIYDLRGTNILEMVTKINSTQLRQFVSIFVDGLGARIKFLYIMSDSKAVELLVKTLKQFLPEKIANRLFVMAKTDELQNNLSPSILPMDYGGNERSLKSLNDDWIEELSSTDHQEYIKIMNKACTDENLRSESKFNEECMGMPGSFRKLIVD